MPENKSCYVALAIKVGYSCKFADPQQIVTLILWYVPIFQPTPKIYSKNDICCVSKEANKHETRLNEAKYDKTLKHKIGKWKVGKTNSSVLLCLMLK